ncbi:MAG: hypothetical protein AAF066_02355 [Pseudomonadota bacterium]
MSILLTREDFGIYLGSALGFGFWSLLDTAGQIEAVTFPDKSAAVAHIQNWDNPPDLSVFTFHDIDDAGRGAVHRDQLIACGFEHFWPELEPCL